MLNIHGAACWFGTNILVLNLDKTNYIIFKSHKNCLPMHPRLNSNAILLPGLHPLSF